MKISILTPTYNRAGLLSRLYSSIIINSKFEIEVQWLIMDDGSTDNTKRLVNEFINEKIIEIQYFHQKNQGKMTAINNLVEKATGDIIIECDSDDWFVEGAFDKIRQAYDETRNRNDLYAMCFLKQDKEGHNIGKEFKKEETTMFDLYFKEGEDGEKALAFFTYVRKQYHHELEKEEKFVTEARMYHKMDKKYKMKCYNTPIMVCEYQKDGYTKNITNIFSQNPNGYFAYFKELFEMPTKEIKFKKRLYMIKHYILFSYLTKQKKKVKQIKGVENKILFLIAYLPGILKSKSQYSRKKIGQKKEKTTSN